MGSYLVVVFSVVTYPFRKYVIVLSNVSTEYMYKLVKKVSYKDQHSICLLHVHVSFIIIFFKAFAKSFAMQNVKQRALKIQV